MSLFQGRELQCIRAERAVFAGLAFDLPAGGALLLTGRNGSGKSSLLRLMAGLLRPAHGGLLWGEVPIAADWEAHRARLRFLGHLDAVKPVLSAGENVAFWARLMGAGPAAVADALAAFALAPLAQVPGRLLSAGQRRRVALARLVAAPGEVWLLDEPSVGLDTDSLAHLNDAIARHRAGGGRVAVASHTPLDLPGAEKLQLEGFAVAAPV